MALYDPSCVLIPWGGSATCPQGQTPLWTSSLPSRGGAEGVHGPASTAALLRTSSVALAALSGHAQLLLVSENSVYKEHKVGGLAPVLGGWKLDLELPGALSEAFQPGKR